MQFYGQQKFDQILIMLVMIDVTINKTKNTLVPSASGSFRK